MEGMVECAEEILGMPVRLGFPVGVKGIVQLVQGPQYATGVGLVRYGADQLEAAASRGDYFVPEEEDEVELPEPEPRGPAGKRKSFLSWLKAAF